MSKYWKLVKLDSSEYVTNPVITRYERAKLLAVTTEYIYSTSDIRVDPSSLYISTDNINPDIKNTLSAEDIYDHDGKPYIKASSSCDIAKITINEGKAPFRIYREIGRNPYTMTIWIEDWDVNDLEKEIFIPFE